MRLLVHLVGAWVASEAASGRYPRPLSLGLQLLVSRLGPQTALMALAGYAIQSLNEGGAFGPRRAPTRKRR
ncbi:MAG: hypothetical protein DI537_35885 [Stutzerimonas stutzeri]|jgi:hypothetical protein|uniref:Uncharacterized protein n=1 Tax=Bosea eneae TaxID=151454 RepID=A0ABW0INJ3_9HYPH|nr:MAG: hypothetical protein DI537_35885 [Stutzerimonas stutzeri]